MCKSMCMNFKLAGHVSHGHRLNRRLCVSPSSFKANHDTFIQRAQEQVKQALSETSSNIVIAVDDSEESHYACNWTKENLYRAGDRIHLVHCVPGLPHLRVSRPAGSQPQQVPQQPLGEQPAADWEERWLADVAQRIQAGLGEQLQRQKVEYEVDVVSEPGAGSKDSIGQLLCRRAEALQAAALVVASRQRGGLQELLMGSVANHCAHNSSRPVVVLHKPRTEEAAGLAAASAEELGAVEGSWEDAGCCSGALCDDPSRSEGQVPPGSRRGRTILVAVDGSEASLRSCQWAAAQLYRPGDRLHLCHVVPALLSSAMGFATDGMLAPSPLSAAEVEREEAVWRELIATRFSAMLEGAGVAYEQEVVTQYSEDPPTAVGRLLCALAAVRGACCIVVASHTRGALMELLVGSTTSYCVHHSRAPVVVLH